MDKLRKQKSPEVFRLKEKGKKSLHRRRFYIVYESDDNTEGMEQGNSVRMQRMNETDN